MCEISVCMSNSLFEFTAVNSLDAEDLLLANGNTVTGYRLTQWCALLKERHTCSPQRERKVHTHTHKHTQRLLGGAWQGATQWTKRTRWHKTSLRWAFYKLEHGRQMEQFAKTRPLGVSERERFLSSPLGSLCSHWNSKVLMWTNGEIQAKSHVIQGFALMGLADCPVAEVSQVHNRNDCEMNRSKWQTNYGVNNSQILTLPCSVTSESWHLLCLPRIWWLMVWKEGDNSPNWRLANNTIL